MRRPTVAVCGLGLVGGSLARALAKRGYVVVGVDRPGPLRRAIASRAIARRARLEAAVAEAGVVVLAAPPAANLRLLRRVARRARPGLVVTDVTSVKRPIVREARLLRLDGFVGGHPMAGRESSGFDAGSADLFRGRPWILTGGAPRAVAAVRRLVLATGARPVAMGAPEHDHVMARLSHLPQIVAWALLDVARHDRKSARRLSLAGPGFRDMTRLARSPRRLWRDILSANRDEVARALRVLSAGLSPRRLWR